MKSELDHLPERQQAELNRVREILLEEFARAISTATQPWKRNGKSPRTAISPTSTC